jgi:hypothetical protein
MNYNSHFCLAFAGLTKIIMLVSPYLLLVRRNHERKGGERGRKEKKGDRETDPATARER